MVRVFGLLAVVLSLVALVLLLVLDPAGAGAEGETPVIVTNFPTPIPYPTMPITCATPQAWSPSASPICGVPAIAVGHSNGEGGYEMASFFAIIAGFGFVGACVLVTAVVKR